MNCLDYCSHERHLVHLDAFRLLHTGNTVKTIYPFLIDPNISYNNEDDLELFKDVIYPHVYFSFDVLYCDAIFRPCNIKFNNLNFDLIAKSLSQFLGFLEQISDFFVNRIIYRLIENQPDIIELIFTNSSDTIKLKIIRCAASYPKMSIIFPKLKLYNTFS